MGWINPSWALKLIVPDPGGIIRDIQSDVDTSLYMTSVSIYQRTLQNSILSNISNASSFFSSIFLS